jgi:hypothetical protein
MNRVQAEEDIEAVKEVRSLIRRLLNTKEAD